MLTQALDAAGHETWWLARHAVRHHAHLTWDGENQGPWSDKVGEVDAVVNVTGYSLANWPWTASRKQRFIESRVRPTRALATAVLQASRKPQVHIQTSGINFYGLAGEATDETSGPADDFLAKLSVEWEAASQPVESAGVRRVITRNAVILDAHAGMLPIMALPVRLFVGGRLADGRQAVPWIHVADYAAAVTFLLAKAAARGPYNLVAPTQTSSDEFMRALASTLRRPYWLPMPAFMLRILLGQMHVLVTAGRSSRPQRLQALGFRYRFPTVQSALADLYGRAQV